MKKKKYEQPKPFVEATKDIRFEGTFEVFVPVPNRVKPQRVGTQFESLARAESWIHSPEGQDMIDKIMSEAAR
jgi:hypothetical protein